MQQEVVWPTAPKGATVESMNIDQKIEEFLYSERRDFERSNMESSSGHKRETRAKGKEKAVDTETQYKYLKDKWKQGKKEIKIACHNINGLKTKGWKLENLIEWANKEELTIVGITEMNITEKEGKFLIYNHNTQYKGYWTSAATDKKK